MAPQTLHRIHNHAHPLPDTKLSRGANVNKFAACIAITFHFLLFTFFSILCVFVFYGLMPEIKMDWIGLVIHQTPGLLRLR